MFISQERCHRRDPIQMRIRVSGLACRAPEPTDEEILKELARALGLHIDTISDLRILKDSIDARRGRRRICRIYTLEITVSGRPTNVPPKGLLVVEIPDRAAGTRPAKKRAGGQKITVVGSGPAGLFAALELAREGAEVSLLEQGPPLKERAGAISGLWSKGILDPTANVQFGAGGAGAFSDGKLTSRSRDPLKERVMAELELCGAPPELLRRSHPHLGTDGIRKLFGEMAARAVSAGVEISFHAEVETIRSEGGRWIVSGEWGERGSDLLVLAPGHSSRRLLRTLASMGVPLTAKGFAVGARVEHAQEWLDRLRYRGRAGSGRLPRASYNLTFKDPQSRRGVYSFCMCPGGLVVNASSEEGRLVTNGMSISTQSSGFANSAIVVTVSPDDLGGPLQGVEFQEAIESAAYGLGGGRYAAPAQRVADFLSGTSGMDLPRSTYRPRLTPADLSSLFPGWITGPLARGLRHFDKIIPGFISEGLLIAPETRTSSPCQFPRESNGSSPGFPGLYIVGEGAGWAGGIVSSAIDALRICEKICRR